MEMLQLIRATIWSSVNLPLSAKRPKRWPTWRHCCVVGWSPNAIPLAWGIAKPNSGRLHELNFHQALCIEGDN
jgi:hypothetical protein